jgi:hypothetical protein
MAARAGAVVRPVALDGPADTGARGGCGEGGGDDDGGGIAAEPEPALHKGLPKGSIVMNLRRGSRRNYALVAGEGAVTTECNTE